MSTAATAPVQTWTCTVYHTRLELVITTPKGKVLSIPMLKFNSHKHLLTEQQSKLILNLFNCWGHGIRYESSFNLEQLTMLKDAKDKLEPVTGTAKEERQSTQVEQAVSKAVRNQMKKQRGESHDENGRVETLGRLNKVLDGEELWMVMYDLPDSKLADCPNPSDWMWRFGFRLNKSVWVLTEKATQEPMVQAALSLWHEHQLETYCWPWSHKVTAEIRAVARKKMEKELIRIGESVMKRLDALAQRFEEQKRKLEEEAEGIEAKVLTNKERQIQDKRLQTMRVIHDESRECLENVILCMEQYDETESFDQLVKANREAIKGLAHQYNLEMRLKGAPVSKLLPEG